MSYFNPDLCETHIVGTESRERMVSVQAYAALAVYHILLTGISYAVPPFCFVRRKPLTSQLLVCLEGCGQVWLDGQWVLCGPGMAYITPTGVLHGYQAIGESHWKVCWITYDEQYQMAIRAPVLWQVEPQEMLLALEGLYHECIGAAEVVVIHQWAQLLQLYAQRMVAQERTDGRLLRLWRLVDSNLSYRWNNEQLAAQIGISSEHLRRLCQQQFGHSPMKQLTSMRMQRAMALLASDAYTVEAVALRIGYENPFAFSTAFKRHTGISPSHHRQKNRS